MYASRYFYLAIYILIPLYYTNTNINNIIINIKVISSLQSIKSVSCSPNNKTTPIISRGTKKSLPHPQPPKKRCIDLFSVIFIPPYLFVDTFVSNLI